jgi:predicted DNA-binding transcriptional regulator AlpA
MSNPFEILEQRLSNIELLLLDMKHPVKESEPLSDRIDKEVVKAMTGQGEAWIYSKTYKGCADPLPFEKFGKKLVFSRKAIQEYIDQHTKRVLKTDEVMSDKLAKSAKRHLK